MAKFCGNCGMRLEDNDRVCGNCGMPCGDMPEVKPVVKPVKANKPKKGIVAAVICVVIAVVLLITGICVASVNSGYKGLLKKTVKAYINYDIDKIVKNASESYDYSYSSYADYYFQTKIDDSLEAFDYYVGYNYKLTYEIEDCYIASDRYLNEVKSTLAAKYGTFDTDIIKKVAIAEVTVTASSKSGSLKDTQTMQITFTKEKGSWKVLYIDFSM
ncbi:MAG: zinc ribbon domain-containing protein [Oscillospiraceae bacterium]|nr:zinc ribbon domain-containing protein [Oscillospiraceae bacterium]